MICYTGELVTPSSGTPRLKSIAVQLGRIVRFCGATKEWWTVLHHSIAAHRLAFYLFRDPEVELYALLHDAHEAMTSDVPRTWKTDSLSILQHNLDYRIFAKLGMDVPTAETRKKVKFIDNALLAAEARYIKLPEFNETILNRTLDELHIAECSLSYPDGKEFNLTDESVRLCSKEVVEEVHILYPKPNDTAIPTSKASLDFMRRVRQALKNVKHEQVKYIQP